MYIYSAHLKIDCNQKPLINLARSCQLEFLPFECQKEDKIPIKKMMFIKLSHLKDELVRYMLVYVKCAYKVFQTDDTFLILIL